MAVKTLTRSFAGGEITPELFGRVDLSKFQTGLAKCRNLLPLPHGPVLRRRGTTFVAQVPGNDPGVRLIPFSFSEEQTYAMSFTPTAGVIRFYTLGGELLSGGTPYEVPHTYTTTSLPRLNYTQSGDVVTLVEETSPIRELSRFGTTDWVLSTLPSNLRVEDSPPTGLSLTAEHSYPTDEDQKQAVIDGEESLSYAVTALVPTGETSRSAAQSVTINLGIQGAHVNLTWNAVAGAVAYNVYKRTGGVYAYIGQTTADDRTFKDDNIRGDPLKTPPTFDSDLNAGANDYPSAVVYYEQRRWFGGTRNAPQKLYGTVIGGFANMGTTRPTTADMAIEVELAAMKMDKIMHMVPMSDLLVLTSSGEWKVYSASGEAVTPMSIAIKTQGYAGANGIKPVVTANTVLYSQTLSGRVRELSYSQAAESFQSTDLTVMAPHLFVGKGIKELAFIRAPYPILWVLRSDGVLLTLTYLPEQEVFGWAQHDTDGKVLSICTVAEGEEDVLYLAVERDTSDGPIRTIERMEAFSDDSDITGFAWGGAAFVDCAFHAEESSPFDQVSGLDWLEGREVAILADGAIHPRRVVTDGTINLEYPVTKVSIGLPFVSEFQTLPLAMEGAQAAGQGTMKNVNRVHIRVFDSNYILMGPTFDKLTLYPPRSVLDPYNNPPEPLTGEITMAISPSWNNQGQVCLRQEEPVNLEVLSMTLEVAVGG